MPNFTDPAYEDISRATRTRDTTSPPVGSPNSAGVPVVTIGSTVDIEIEVDGAFETETWKIGPEDASDLEQGVIGAHAPLASALLHAREGDVVTFAVGRQLRTVLCRRIR
jgi:transcription elongation GreA/GreB family factor